MSTTKAAETTSAGERQSSSSAVAASPQSMGLAQQFGNQNLLMLLRARMLQAKLTVSHPSDAYEQEADRVADQVMRMPERAPRVSPIPASAEDARALHRSSDATADAPAVDAATEHSIQSLSGRGSPLPAAVRSVMEPRFNVDFGAVRVHNDAHAHGLARAVSAQAFTVGPNIVFGAGYFAPHTGSGQHLLAHELTHTIQQGAASSIVARAPQSNQPSRPAPSQIPYEFTPSYLDGDSPGELAKKAAQILVKGGIKLDQLVNYKLIVVHQKRLYIYAPLVDSTPDPATRRKPDWARVSATFEHDFEVTTTPPVYGLTVGLQIPNAPHARLGRVNGATKAGLTSTLDWDPAERITRWSTMTANEEKQYIGTKVPVVLVTGRPAQAQAQQPQTPTTSDDGTHPGGGGEVRHTKAGPRSKEKGSREKSAKGGGEKSGTGKARTSPTANGKTSVEFRPTFDRDAFKGNPDPDSKPATDGAFPSFIKASPALIPLHGSSSLTMHLVPGYNRIDPVAQVWDASTLVQYKWERWDVTQLLSERKNEKVAEEFRQIPLDKSASIVDEWEDVDAHQRAAEYEAQNQHSETIIDSGGTSTKPPEEREQEVAVERFNYGTRWVSAIVSAGGHLVDSVFHHVTKSDNSITREWNSKGTFLVRCVAWPQENHGRRYLPSVATAFVEVRPADYIARNTLDTEELQLNLWRLEREQATDPRVKDELSRKIHHLEITAYGSAVEALDAAVEERQAELSSAKGNKRQKLEDELKALSAQRDLAKQGEAGITRPDGKPTHAFRPRVAMMSSMTGTTVPLLMELLPATQYNVKPGKSKREWVLMDVAAPGGPLVNRHFGDGPTDGAAIEAAFQEFATHNGYGPGTIAMYIPESIPNISKRYLHEESLVVGDQLAKQRLSDIVTVLTAASLFSTAAGEAAAIIGGAMSYGNVVSRLRSGTLELDSALVSDMLAVLGTIGSVGGRMAGLAVVKAGDAYAIALESGNAVAIARAWQRMGRANFATKMAALANDISMWGGIAMAEEAVMTGLQAISRAERNGDITQAAAGSQRVKILLGALQSHAFAFTGLLHRPHGQMEVRSSHEGRLPEPAQPRTENATVTSDRTAAVDHEALGTRSNDDKPLRVKDPDEQAPAHLTERNAMDTGDGGRRGKPDSDPLAPMPRTGRKSPERLFELLEKGGSRKLKQATVEGQAKNRPESGVFRRGLTSPEAAYRAYNKALAGSAGREVGIFYNTETGEYAVIIDSAVKVSAPENESGWIGLVHFHHNEFNSWVLRLPSPRSDFSDLWARTRSENERVREFVEWNDPRGGRGRTELGIDLAWPEKPIYVRIIEPSGKQWIERFKTEADYHRYYDSHTKFVEPESALHDWVLSGARKSSTDPDEGAGASSQRTAIDPVGGQPPGTGADLVMLNRARSAIREKLSEMLRTNMVVERLFTVEQVQFRALSIKRVNDVLIVSFFYISKIGPTPRGHGSRIMQEFEKAAMDVARAEKGVRRLRREAPVVVNSDWADVLTDRGYKPMGGDEKTKGGSTSQAGKDLKSGGDKKTEGESKPQRLVLEIEVPGSSGRTPKRPAPAPPASKVSGPTPVAPPPTRGTGVTTGEIHAPDAAPPERRGTRVPTESDPKVVVEDPVMTERARSQLRGALLHLLSTGRKEIVRVEGVIFGVVEVRLLESNSKAEPGSGPALEVSYLTISKTQVGATIPGRGVLMHGVLEEAARDIGRMEGATSVSVRVDAVENEVFAHELRTRGYEEVDDKSIPGKKVEGKSTPRSVNLRRELVSPPEVQPPAEAGKGPPPLDVGLTWRTYRRNTTKPVVDQLRVNSPDRLQYCGPACAAMLLQELGWQPNIETLAKSLWAGMSATNLAAALRAHGLPSAHVASPNVGDIERAVQGGRTPAIAVMSEPGTTGLHWVVVDGFTTRPEFGPGIFVAIRDPYGASQYFVSRADFARRLAGGEMVLTDPLVTEPPPARPKK